MNVVYNKYCYQLRHIRHAKASYKAGMVCTSTPHWISNGGWRRIWDRFSVPSSAVPTFVRDIQKRRWHAGRDMLNAAELPISRLALELLSARYKRATSSGGGLTFSTVPCANTSEQATTSFL